MLGGEVAKEKSWRAKECIDGPYSLTHSYKV